MLLYHSVGACDPTTPPGLTVDGGTFRRQIAWLSARGYRSASEADCIAHIAGEPTEERLVAITFDDAYADLCVSAFPVLQEYGFSALVFVPTALIGDRSVWDEGNGWASQALMSESQIRSWAAEGIEFGSHTRTHPDLATLNGEELKEEIVGSASELEAVVDCEVRTFAYPYGSASPTAREMVASTYSVGFSTREGVNSVGEDRALVRRTMVFPGDNALDLTLAVRCGVNYRQWMRVRLGRLKRDLLGS